MKAPMLKLVAFVAIATTPAFALAANYEITFENPEEFRDLRMSIVDSPRGREMLIGQFEKFMLETMENRLDGDYTVAVTVTDIDMAGDFEWWRGPGFDDVRIVKRIYPAYLEFTYTVRDSAGAVLVSGEYSDRNHIDQMLSLRDRNETLPYVRDLFRRWVSKVSRDLRGVQS